MSTLSSAKRYSPEDLLRMPDGDLYDLVDGQLVQHTMSLWASYVAGKILERLHNHCRPNKSGWVLPEGATYQCFPDDPGKVRKAEVSFIRKERLTIQEALEEGHIPLHPDLAVEVVSPNDVLYDVDRKVQEFLSAGVKLVWVVNPQARTLRIHRADGAHAFLQGNDEVTGEDVIPGFKCSIADFFVPPA